MKFEIQNLPLVCPECGAKIKSVEFSKNIYEEKEERVKYDCNKELIFDGSERKDYAFSLCNRSEEYRKTKEGMNYAAKLLRIYINKMKPTDDNEINKKIKKKIRESMTMHTFFAERGYFDPTGKYF